MVVQHNITAMNANRMLGVTTTGQSKSTEKLSSGYRINRAADDAAGLSISEKMRKQIRGLSQASTNAQGTVTDLTDTTTAENLANYFDAKTGVYKGGLYSRLTADNADGANETKGTITQIGAEQINKFVDVTVTEKTTTTTGALSLNLHVGADSTDNNKIKLEIESMSAASLGVDGLKVDTEESATSAIDTITAAIQKVSDQRSKLGAVQNRLEHTISNLDNVVENTTSAESRIRDTDMAEEMVSYSKNNILMQAGQSMLAQANQQNQGVLSLLQ